MQNDDQRCGVVTRGKRSAHLFLCVDSQKGFFPGVESFSFCVSGQPGCTAFLCGASDPPPGGKGGPERRRTLSAPKTLFSEKPFSRGYSFETVLDMVMGIIDACYSVGPPLCFAGCGTRLPFLVFFISLVYVRGLVRECSDRVDACACDLWADFLGAFVCE